MYDRITAPGLMEATTSAFCSDTPERRPGKPGGYHPERRRPAASDYAVIQRFLKEVRTEVRHEQLVEKRLRGPDQASRERQHSWLWGEVRNAASEIRTARLETANGYEVTVHGVLLAVRRLLEYSGPGGYFTPSQLFGPRCVEQLPGSGTISIS